MHDKFRKKYRLPAATERLRRQIALEAARRMLGAAGPRDDTASLDWLDRMGENDYYVAKRKAAAVLGHRVRPGDLPTDRRCASSSSSCGDRDQVRARSRTSEPAMPEPGEGEAVAPLAQHLDRFAVYRMRLAPLEAIKQNPKYHPEGDALYHSLQVFHLAREARPYDEEFLLAALLHDVGKAIDPQDHCRGRSGSPARVDHGSDLMADRAPQGSAARPRKISRRAAAPRARDLGIP